MNLHPFPVRHAVAAVTIAAVALAAAGQAAAQGRGQVGGRVVDEAGAPLGGVTITATNPQANPPTFQTETGDDGRFAILGLMSGQWMFRADCVDACAERNGADRGYNPSEGPSAISQTRNPPVDFTLSRIRHPLALALGDEAVAGIDLDAIDADIASADAAFNAGGYDDAIAGYESVLERLPQLTDLHFNIGNAYAQKLDYPAAINAFDTALAEDAENQSLLVARARARLAMGAADEADRQLLEQAASGLNASREDLYNQGEQAFAQGDIATAAQWYEKAIAVDPNWGKPLFKLALVALNQGDMDTAKEFFQRVVDVDPGSEEGAQSQATLDALP